MNNSKDTRKKSRVKLPVLFASICSFALFLGAVLTPTLASAYWAESIGTPDDITTEGYVDRDVVVGSWGTTSSVASTIQDIKINDPYLISGTKNKIHDFTLRSTLYAFPTTYAKGDVIVCVDSNWNPVVYKIEGPVTLTCIDDFVNAISDPSIPLVKAYYGGSVQDSTDDRYHIQSAPVTSGSKQYLVRNNNSPLPVTNQDNFFELPSDGLTYIAQKYYEGSYVKLGANYYRAKRTTTNSPAASSSTNIGDGTDWYQVQAYTPGQSISAWNKDVTYSRHSIATQNGIYWVSNKDGNRNHNPEDWHQEWWSRATKWTGMTKNEPIDADVGVKDFQIGWVYTRYKNGQRWYMYCRNSAAQWTDPGAQSGNGPAWCKILQFSTGFGAAIDLYGIYTRCYTIDGEGDPVFWVRDKSSKTNEYPGTGSEWRRVEYQPCNRYYYTYDQYGKMCIWENPNGLNVAPEAPNPYTWTGVNMDSITAPYVITNNVFYATDVVTQRTGVWNIQEQAWIGGENANKIKYNWKSLNYYRVGDVVRFGTSKTNNYRYFKVSTAPINHATSLVDPFASTGWTEVRI